jgi:hypothetical protein
MSLLLASDDRPDYASDYTIAYAVGRGHGQATRVTVPGRTNPEFLASM